ncbi:hypothetical protein ARMSODRAFT_959475 [Armillaria solidipes]|uniref:Uncharacterized protein n=1 Tax=Armillaria solidipes TaxID=1076256 RepID=A0A2H3B8T3_9AGAR|nr:hypothetical protein ARMSODRAFT_959475 [Armillaria solidipes]
MPRQPKIPPHILSLPTLAPAAMLLRTHKINNHRILIHRPNDIIIQQLAVSVPILVKHLDSMDNLPSVESRVNNGPIPAKWGTLPMGTADLPEI